MLAGISGGIFLKMLVEATSNASPDNKFVVAFSDLSTWYFISLGVFLAVLTILVQTRKVPEKHREIFDIIDAARARNGISDIQHRQAYLNVITRVVAEISTPTATVPEAKEIAQEAIAETQNPPE